jgi:hypothetical protein
MSKELFVALVSLLPEDDKEWNDILENDGNLELNNYLAKQISSFVNSVQTRLNDGDQCYLLLKKEEDFVPMALISGYYLSEDCENDLRDKLNELDYISIIDDSSISFRVAFFTEGLDHWDYDFIKLSENYGGTLVIFGHDNDHEDLVRQIYDNGDLDTGIIANSDDEDSYMSDNALEPYDLSRAIFEKNFYNSAKRK